MREYEHLLSISVASSMNMTRKVKETRDPNEPVGLLPGTLNHLLEAEQILRQKPILHQKIQEKGLIGKKRVTTALGEVIRFLYLIAYSKKKLTPGKTIDLVWHEFVLCTQTYAHFCEKSFGRFIHHDPGGSDDENQQQFRLTLKLYHLYYGPPSPEFWGEVPRDKAESHCGACQSISS